MKPLIGLIFLAGAAGPAGADDAPRTGQAPGPAVERPKPQAEYQCPTTSYLNCMPPIGADRRQSCSKDYIAWVQKNCPKTQIVY